MDGVTILNTIELTGVSSGTWVVLLVSSLVMSVLIISPEVKVSSNTANLIVLLVVIDTIILFGSMFVDTYYGCCFDLQVT